MRGAYKQITIIKFKATIRSTVKNKTLQSIIIINQNKSDLIH